MIDKIIIAVAVAALKFQKWCSPISKQHRCYRFLHRFSHRFSHTDVRTDFCTDVLTDFCTDVRTDTTNDNRCLHRFYKRGSRNEGQMLPNTNENRCLHRYYKRGSHNEGQMLQTRTDVCTDVRTDFCTDDFNNSNSIPIVGTTEIQILQQQQQQQHCNETLPRLPITTTSKALAKISKVYQNSDAKIKSINDL